MTGRHDPTRFQRLKNGERPSIFWLDVTMSEIRDKRPENIRPKMDVGERAKQFAPFAALGRMDEVLCEVEKRRDVGDPERVPWLEDLSLEEIDMLSAEGELFGTDE